MQKGTYIRKKTKFTISPEKTKPTVEQGVFWKSFELWVEGACLCKMRSRFCSELGWITLYTPHYCKRTPQRAHCCARMRRGGHTLC